MIKVGVFDSGVGGLTVLKDCARLMPGVCFYYFGDNGNAPYGERPEREIVPLVRAALERFRRLGVCAAVLACNTATSVCAEQMRREFPFPIVGMEPAVSLAARCCKNALVLCTPATASGSRLASLLARFPQTRFTVFPAKGLAAAIERSLIGGTFFELFAYIPPTVETENRQIFSEPLSCGGFSAPEFPENRPCGHAAQNAVQNGDGSSDERRQNMGIFPPKKAVFPAERGDPAASSGLSTSDPSFDGVVLGCTHYLFFRRKIAQFYRVPVFDGNEGTAKRLKALLFGGISVHRDLSPIDKNFRAISPVFLGEYAEINEKIYFSNKCFQNFL